MGKRVRELLIGLCLCAIIAARADGQSSAQSICGVSCLQVAAQREGLNPAWSDLLQPQFIGSTRGSSIEELLHAAAAIGMHARAVQRLVIADLRDGHPQFILHVRSHPGLPEPDHFVLLLDVGESLRVYDPLRGEREMSRAELATVWRGVAVLVSRSPVRSIDAASGSLVHLTVWLGVGSLLALTLKAWQPPGRAARVPWLMALLLAAALGPLWQYLQLGVVPGRLRVLDEYVTDAFLPQASVDDVRSGQFVLLDVRRPESTEQGTIRGARNLDGSRMEAERSGVLRDLPVDPGTPVILFCEDETCGNARRAAQVLISDGFRDVRVFPVGLKGWLESSDETQTER